MAGDPGLFCWMPSCPSTMYRATAANSCISAAVRTTFRAKIRTFAASINYKTDRVRSLQPTRSFRFKGRCSPGHQQTGQRALPKGVLQDCARPSWQRSGLLHGNARRWSRNKVVTSLHLLAGNRGSFRMERNCAGCADHEH